MQLSRASIATKSECKLLVNVCYLSNNEQNIDFLMLLTIKIAYFLFEKLVYFCK